MQWLNAMYIYKSYRKIITGISLSWTTLCIAVGLLVRLSCVKKSKVLSRALRPMGRRWSPFHSPQPDTSRSRKTTDTGPVHRMVYPFTPQLSLVLINRLQRDGTLSWRWYTAAVGGIRTRDLAIALYHSATTYLKEWIKIQTVYRWHAVWLAASVNLDGGRWHWRMHSDSRQNVLHSLQFI